MPTPPKITAELSLVYLPYTRTLSSTWAASSRVGVRIRARMARGDLLLVSLLPTASVDRRCSSGRVKPAVLPVPVCAPASRSPPFSTAGMACCWIGVGEV
jgi:hypothetical protein